MESAGEGDERVLDAFREGRFMELLSMESGDGGHRVRVVQGEEEVGLEGFIVRCPPPYPLPPSSSPPTPSYRMLCFGGDEGFTENGNINGFFQKSSESCSPASSSSSNVSLSKAKKKTKERRHRPAAAKREATATTPKPATAPMPIPSTAAKKPRKEKEQSQGHRPPTSNRRATKVRKEKLGDRITALQQLVSPFGKSDTASVLLEALGYIRFLHDQVQVLSSPYLQRLPSPPDLHAEDGGGEAALWPDLRSRGLCLVPLACTAHVAACNGADFWSPAMGSGGGDSHHLAVSKH